MLYTDEEGDRYEPCEACDDGRVYHTGIPGTNAMFPEHVCGRCDKALCTDCADESTWTYDGHPCCWVCCAELDDEHGTQSA